MRKNDENVEFLNIHIYLKNERGITLIALVVAIVVFLILVGITINLVLSDDGILQKAKEAKRQNKIAVIEEKANMVYVDKKLREGPVNFNTNPTMEEIVEELNKNAQQEGYSIEQVVTDGSKITGIELEQNEMKLEYETSNDIKVNLIGSNGGEAYKYYVKIEEKYYEMHYNNEDIKIDRTEATKPEEGGNSTKTLTVSSSNEAIVTAELQEKDGRKVVTVTANNIAGTITITVKYGDNISAKCTVTVKESREKIPPEAQIEVCCNEPFNLNDPADVKVTQTDNEGGSGIDIGNCKWIYSMKAEEYGIDNAKWKTEGTEKSFTETEERVDARGTEEGTYYLHVLSVDNDGNKKETISEAITVKDTTINWDINKVDKAISEDGITVPIPKGFTMSTIDGENRVETGLVIKQGTNGGATSGVNEFVWVPVHCNSKMFEIVNGQNVGILYNFSGTTSKRKNYPTTANSGDREPDILMGTEHGDANTEVGKGIDQLKKVIGLTGTNEQIFVKWRNQLQDEFDEMKESVEKYKGFYIGRYETGDLSKATAVVKKSNSDIGRQNWYVQYQKSKVIYNTSGIKTSMIWRCQWDACMRWFQTSKDKAVVKFVTDSTGKGNYQDANGNKPIATGSKDEYKVNNIYDMAGNVSDWTIGAWNDGWRNIRWRFLWNFVY